MVLVDGGSTSFTLPYLIGTPLAGLGLSTSDTVNWNVQAMMVPGFNFNTLDKDTVTRTFTDRSESATVSCPPYVHIVTGTITLPASVTNQEWFVGIDADINGDNGMIAYQQGTVTGNSFNYVINLPTSGDFYVFAEVDVSGGGIGPWETGDYVGEACGNRLDGTQCTVNICADSTFDFTLVEMP